MFGTERQATHTRRTDSSMKATIRRQVAAVFTAFFHLFLVSCSLPCILCERAGMEVLYVLKSVFYYLKRKDSKDDDDDDDIRLLFIK